MKRRTAPEIIGAHFGWDMADVSDCRYQPTRFTSPGVYAIGEDMVCAPSGAQKPPKAWTWREIGQHYGRKVFLAIGPAA